MTAARIETLERAIKRALRTPGMPVWIAEPLDIALYAEAAEAQATQRMEDSYGWPPSSVAADRLRETRA